jgi:hypothetical protein
VPSPILDEVEQLDRAGCERLGLTVIDPRAEQLLESGAGVGKMSRADNICRIVAHDGHHGCITNDARLHRSCKDQRIEAIRGFRLLIELVEAEELTRVKANEVATGIQRRKKLIGEDVLEAFRREIGFRTAGRRPRF